MSFTDLQERAKALLMTSGSVDVDGGVGSLNGINASAAQLIQFIEEFCREGDRVVEENKRDKVDLQKQVRSSMKWHMERVLLIGGSFFYGNLFCFVTRRLSIL